jgi:putative PIN family toxin of toxin-antitoxin system
MGTAPRVVLDTNVVLSALLFRGGRLEGLRHAWQAGRITPLLSSALAEELIAALAYPKFRLTAPDREDLLADYVPYTQVVLPGGKAPRLPHCRDPGDLAFLELAALGKARYLVTGDKDLLAVAHGFRFRIVTPAVFIQDVC